MKEDIKRYAQLNLEKQKIDMEMETLKSKIQDSMEQEGYEVAETEYGVMNLYKRRTYQYPENVKELTEKVDKLKQEAEQLGTATYKETTYLRFNKVK